MTIPLTFYVGTETIKMLKIPGYPTKTAKMCQHCQLYLTRQNLTVNKIISSKLFHFYQKMVAYCWVMQNKILYD